MPEHALAGWRARRSCPRPVLAAVLCASQLLAACVSPVAFEAPAGVPGPGCVIAPAQRDIVVGVAMSGGGSRAALFGLAGLKALGATPLPTGGSMLERVNYLSSVSGGSLAASYYTLTKPPSEVPVLDRDGKLSPTYLAYFEQASMALSQPFGPEVFVRQITRLRWFNSALTAISLSEILREDLLGDANWHQLSRREAAGDAPGLIINTTLYNNGRRLALTPLPSSAFRYDFFDTMRDSLAKDKRHVEFAPSLRQRWEKLLPMTPQDIGMDPCSYPVAGAAAGSASFPPLIGPITFRVNGIETYWHLGDGGLYENQGVESLLFLFLKQLQQDTVKRALLIELDSSFPFAVGEHELNRRAQPFSLFSFDFSRIPSIMEERATTYQNLFFRSLQAEGVFPDDHIFHIVSLRHTDARWRDDLADLPPVCAGENLDSPAAVRRRLAEIPTRLQLASLCDRQLLAVAADKLVAEHRQEILDFMASRPSGAPAMNIPP